MAEKLLQIRTALGLSQSEMLRRLGADDAHAYQRLSEWETGEREPSVLLLLQYARVAGVHMEDIVDDELDLPDQLPGPVKYEGLRRKASSRKRKR